MSADSPDQPTTPATNPPPPPPPADEDTSTAGMRALAVIFALVLAFAAAVMIMVAVDIGDTPTCDEILAGDAAIPSDGECFDGSSGAKSVSVGLAYASGAVGAIAALLALAFAITGRRGRLLVQVAIGAIILGGLSILVGSV